MIQLIEFIIKVAFMFAIVFAIYSKRLSKKRHKSIAEENILSSKEDIVVAKLEICPQCGAEMPYIGVCKYCNFIDSDWVKYLDVKMTSDKSMELDKQEQDTREKITNVVKTLQPFLKVLFFLGIIYICSWIVLLFDFILSTW